MGTLINLFSALALVLGLVLLVTFMNARSERNPRLHFWAAAVSLALGVPWLVTFFASW